MSKANSSSTQKKIKNIFNKGDKFVSNSFIAFSYPDNAFSCVIIASKKIGNAVKRNRSKRRLRELVRLYLKPENQPMSFIFIARVLTADADFGNLIADFNKFIKKITRNQLSENKDLEQVR